MNLQEKMTKEWFKNHLNSEPFEIYTPKPSGNKISAAVKTMSSRKYWTRVNTIEAFGFATKIAIIFPGLLFGKQLWWIYIFAIISSVALIWTSTRKTLPTIILFNVAWILLASLAIIKHFW